MKLNQITTKFKSDIFGIDDLTQSNNHAEAIIRGLKLLGNDATIKPMIAKMNKMIAQTDKLGHAGNTIPERDGLQHDMIKIAKKRLTPEQFKLFRDAY